MRVLDVVFRLRIETKTGKKADGQKNANYITNSLSPHSKFHGGDSTDISFVSVEKDLSSRCKVSTSPPLPIQALRGIYRTPKTFELRKNVIPSDAKFEGCSNVMLYVAIGVVIVTQCMLCYCSFHGPLRPTCNTTMHAGAANGHRIPHPRLQNSTLTRGAVQVGLTEVWKRVPNLRERIVTEYATSSTSLFSFSGIPLATTPTLRPFSNAPIIGAHIGVVECS